MAMKSSRILTHEPNRFSFPTWHWRFAIEHQRSSLFFFFPQRIFFWKILLLIRCEITSRKLRCSLALARATPPWIISMKSHATPANISNTDILQLMYPFSSWTRHNYFSLEISLFPVEIWNLVSSLYLLNPTIS
jgi:hypothetical protein